MKEWEEVRKFGVPVLTWWEVLVKPGIRKLAIARSKEMNKNRRGLLNLLMMRQSFLSKKVQCGETGSLAALREVQLKIGNDLQDKVKHQSRASL